MSKKKELMYETYNVTMMKDDTGDVSMAVTKYDDDGQMILLNVIEHTEAVYIENRLLGNTIKKEKSGAFEVLTYKRGE